MKIFSRKHDDSDSRKKTIRSNCTARSEFDASHCISAIFLFPVHFTSKKTARIILFAKQLNSCAPWLQEQTASVKDRDKTTRTDVRSWIIVHEAVCSAVL